MDFIQNTTCYMNKNSTTKRKHQQRQNLCFRRLYGRKKNFSKEKAWDNNHYYQPPPSCGQKEVRDDVSYNIRTKFQGDEGAVVKDRKDIITTLRLSSFTETLSENEEKIREELQTVCDKGSLHSSSLSYMSMKENLKKKTYFDTDTTESPLTMNNAPVSATTAAQTPPSDITSIDDNFVCERLAVVHPERLGAYIITWLNMQPHIDCWGDSFKTPSTGAIKNNTSSASAISICTANTNNTTDSASFDSFNSSSLSITSNSLRIFVERITQDMCCSSECFVLACVYLKRFLQKNAGFKFTVFNIQRFYLVALVVAAKYHDDISFHNSYYLSLLNDDIQQVQIFNFLERTFLTGLNYEIFVSGEAFLAAETIYNAMASAALQVGWNLERGFPEELFLCVSSDNLSNCENQLPPYHHTLRLTENALIQPSLALQNSKSAKGYLSLILSSLSPSNVEPRLPAMSASDCNTASPIGITCIQCYKENCSFTIPDTTSHLLQSSATPAAKTATKKTEVSSPALIPIAFQSLYNNNTLLPPGAVLNNGFPFSTTTTTTTTTYKTSSSPLSTGNTAIISGYATVGETSPTLLMPTIFAASLVATTHTYYRNICDWQQYHHLVPPSMSTPWAASSPLLPYTIAQNILLPNTLHYCNNAYILQPFLNCCPTITCPNGISAPPVFCRC